MSDQKERVPRRPVFFLIIFLVFLCVLDLGLFSVSFQRRSEQRDNAPVFDIATAGIGLTDLCVATEARYTRNPAVTDLVVPFMDYPGAIEHFPTGSFWAPPKEKFRLDDK